MVTAAANHTWISWGPGGPWSEFTTSRFHAQIKKTDQPWEVGSPQHTHTHTEKWLF